MKFLCDIQSSGIRILRCFSYDGQIEIPEKIHGMEVKELGAYVFADTIRRKEVGVKYLAQLQDEEEDAPKQGVVEGNKEIFSEKNLRSGEICPVWEWKACAEEILFWEALEDGTPVVKGNKLRSATLPKSLKKIGAYAFYQCEKLERLNFVSTVFDLGAGLFTGCYGIRELDIRIIPGEKSCLKEILAELRQTLRVNCCNEHGELTAKLIFPEYFEESVENTPARILTQEMHGCGHRYRNAFSGTEIQYPVYDKLFPHVQVQENCELVTELALGRLRFPVQLNEERKNIYEEYAAEHGREVVKLALKHPEESVEILYFAGRAKWCTEKCMEEMLAEAGNSKNPQAAGILMELRRRRKKEKEEEKKEKTRGKVKENVKENRQKQQEETFEGDQKKNGVVERRKKRFVL